MYGIHFSSTFYPVGIDQEEVAVHAPGKHFTIGNLCLMAFAWAEFWFPFQVDVPGGKKPLVNVCVDGTDRQIQFRMVCDDLVGGLSLVYQVGNKPVFLEQFFFGHVNASSAAGKKLAVFAVSKTGIIDILVCNGAFVDHLITAVTDIRGLIQTPAAFPDEIPAGLVAGRAGGAFDAAEDDLVTGIGLTAMVSMDTEVFGIIKSAFVIPVAETVFPHLLGDSGWILAEEAGNVFKRSTIGKSFFDVEAVFQGKMLLVSRY